MKKITLYGKPGCCLCDEAKDVVERVQENHPFKLEQVDISKDSQLLGKYGERIPLIWVDGKMAFKFRIDEGALVAKLNGSAQ